MKVLDLGRRFGMSGLSVVSAWKPETFQPTTLDETLDILPSCDLVIFGGGSDIHPDMYGHRICGAHTGNSRSVRDIFEQTVFSACQKYKIPMFGICRGAQLICALSGGALIQHVSGHTSSHNIVTDEGKVLLTNSIHHQMMVPDKTDHVLCAWSTNVASRAMYDTNKLRVTTDFFQKEPEIVYFKRTNGLAVQGHPEMIFDALDPTLVYIRQLINKYLLGNKPEFAK